MPIPEHLKADVAALPDAPGVYIYKDEQEQEIYVGKAVSLRKRVRQYFDERPKDDKTLALVSHIHSIEYVECQSEVEAFLLENRLIKDLQPVFNVRGKDDSNFPLVEITDEDYPRVIITRDRTNPRSKYYGPFISGGWLRVALRILQRVFRYRTCRLSIQEGDPRNRYVRPCLEHHIGRCHAPCAGRQSSAAYKASLRRLGLFLQGHSAEVARELEREMKQASRERRYEDAAGLRDTLSALRSLRDHGSLSDEMEPRVLHLDPKDGLSQLHALLGLPRPPRRIEGIDIAHLHGAETVGALVTFVDGLPAREQYRRFRIKLAPGGDDFASVGEVVSRRYGRLLREGAGFPDLVLIDGGIGQLHAARAALVSVAPVAATPQELATAARVCLASLAKKEEIIYTLEHPEGIKLPRRSPALRLLQYVRDEAHRFARHYHHILRRKRVLDG